MPQSCWRLCKSYWKFSPFYWVRLLRLSLKILIANFTKWLNTLKQFVGKLASNCLSVFGLFVGLALKGLTCNFNEKRFHRRSSLRRRLGD